MTKCYFEDRYLDTSVFMWEDLSCDRSIDGPAIIIDKNRCICVNLRCICRHHSSVLTALINWPIIFQHHPGGTGLFGPSDCERRRVYHRGNGQQVCPGDGTECSAAVHLLSPLHEHRRWEVLNRNVVYHVRNKTLCAVRVNTLSLSLSMS